MKKYIVIAFLFSAIICCKNKNTEAVKFTPPVVKADMEMDAPVSDAKAIPGDDARVAAGYENAGQSTPTKPSVTDTSKKIIKDGTIVFATNNLTTTRQTILSALKKYGGYVEEDNQSTNGDENRKDYNLKARVPANNFDLLLDAVSSTADKIDSKNISVTDVTTRFIDIKTRLNNKQILEKRYLDLLSKSSKVTDLLEIENKLTEIRSDIESTQGQLNYLNKQVALSSLNITFYTKQSAQVDNGNGVAYKLKTALTDGWQSLQNLFFSLIALWPFIFLIAALYFLIKKWWHGRKKTK